MSHNPWAAIDRLKSSDDKLRAELAKLGWTLLESDGVLLFAERPGDDVMPWATGLRRRPYRKLAARTSDLLLAAVRDANREDGAP